jgi:hypothetical protein
VREKLLDAHEVVDWLGHGMRHTALTETAAAGVPGMFVQAKAGQRARLDDRAEPACASTEASAFGLATTVSHSAPTTA